MHKKVLTNKRGDGNIDSSKEKKNNFIKKGAQ